MKIIAQQYKEHVIIPALDVIGLNSEAAVNLLLGTCAQESHLNTYVVQIKGPALGPYDMEVITHDDIYYRYLQREDKKDLLASVKKLIPDFFNNKQFLHYCLIACTWYATAMARIKYLPYPERLPHKDDIEGLATYWKKYYNSKHGKGTVKEFVDNYHRFIL